MHTTISRHSSSEHRTKHEAESLLRRGMYKDYYSRQVGGQMPIFVGSRYHERTNQQTNSRGGNISWTTA